MALKNRKLTAEQVKEIRARAAALKSAGVPIHTTLAREYSVTEGTIRALLEGRTWKEVK